MDLRQQHDRARMASFLIAAISDCTEIVMNSSSKVNKVALSLVIAGSYLRWING